MANIKSSKKNSIQSENKKKNNNRKKSIIKTYVKKVRLFISLNNFTKAIFFFKKMQSLVDKYAVKKVIHKNKAARYKSNLYMKIKNIKIKELNN
ncbi:30S ribosomal protein S20 [Buchnera aphidicola]|uniref:30S ribosomal protein S20 n=1 Tax=Buchnera aphidicola TaxID=9 RepID=UPI0020925E84|nr:30S ribosomal protein S20 [Buchnera aphidicola]USS94234.1 30S ribosomal protein S20 [Buchnera aphidicola (Sipha maydis)]WII23783.1 30S ribosomal protein S20 [Buchnera aphidicola (Sipha maydis)]